MTQHLHADSPEVMAMRAAVREAAAKDAEAAAAAEVQRREGAGGLSLLGLSLLGLSLPVKGDLHAGRARSPEPPAPSAAAVASLALQEAEGALLGMRAHLEARLGAPLLAQALQLAEGGHPPHEGASEERWRRWEAARLHELAALLRRRCIAATLPEEGEEPDGGGEARGGDGAADAADGGGLEESLARAVLALALWSHAAQPTADGALPLAFAASSGGAVGGDGGGPPRAASPFSSLRTSGSQWSVRGPWIDLLVGGQALGAPTNTRAGPHRV